MVQSLLDKFGEPDVDFAKLPANSGYRLVKYDINQDQRLNQEEMTEAIRDILRFGFPIAEADWQSSVEPNLEFLDETIRDAPHYMTPRFVRAWIRATCADPQFRDSDQALKESISLCEQTKYQDATFLELLAAAHASSNDFASALRWQTEAVRIHAEKGPVSSIRCLEEARVRLKAYEHHKLCDGKLPRTNDLFLFGTRESPIPQERDVSPPYLSPQVVLNAKRIIGNRAAWSPDGTKLYGEGIPMALKPFLNRSISRRMRLERCVKMGRSLFGAQLSVIASILFDWLQAQHCIHSMHPSGLATPMERTSRV